MTLKTLRPRFRGRGDPRFSSRAPISMRTALLGSILLVSFLTLAHSSLALWNGSAPIPSTTVVSGTLTATVTIDGATSSVPTSAAFPPETWSGMLPGETRLARFTVANTGTAPFVVAASLDASTVADRKVTFAVGAAPCASDGSGLDEIGDLPRAVGPVQNRGEATTFCLAVSLDPGIPADDQGSVIDSFTVQLAANQAIG